MFQAGKLSFDVLIERFDRLLIAQGRVEDMVLATSDEQIGRYDVTTIW